MLGSGVETKGPISRVARTSGKDIAIEGDDAHAGPASVMLRTSSRPTQRMFSKRSPLVIAVAGQEKP